MNTVISHASEEIPFILRRSARARSVRISIYSDGTVVVTAPRWVSEKFVEKFIAEKTEWIGERVAAFKKRGLVTKIPGGAAEYAKHKDEALKKIVPILERLNAYYGFTYKRISVRKQKHRWGSCSRTGNINFNFKLLFLPDALAEYVVAHELCHLQQLNHSPAFWKLVAETIPDYKERKKQLRNFTT